MASNKFLSIAKKIAEKDKIVFDTLMEFEKTKKIITKTRLNFTIDKKIAEQFRKFCRDHRYNMSAKIEEVMEKIIEEN